MKNHKNARLTVYSRELLVRRNIDHDLRPEEAAQAIGVSVRTAYKWLKRAIANTARPAWTTALLAPRTARMPPRQRVGRASSSAEPGADLSPDQPSAVRRAQHRRPRILQREGLNRLSSLEPAAPVQFMNTTSPVGYCIRISKLGGSPTRFARRRLGIRSRRHRRSLSDRLQGYPSRRDGEKRLRRAGSRHQTIAYCAKCPTRGQLRKMPRRKKRYVPAQTIDIEILSGIALSASCLCQKQRWGKKWGKNQRTKKARAIKNPVTAK